MLGCGEWHIFIARRGGEIELEVPWGTISLGRVMNDMGSCTIRVPVTDDTRTVCCEIFELTEPWEHELVCYRDRINVWTGPVVETHSSPTGGTITCRDLFQWFERRELV